MPGTINVHHWSTAVLCLRLLPITAGAVAAGGGGTTTSQMIAGERPMLLCCAAHSSLDSAFINYRAVHHEVFAQHCSVYSAAAALGGGGDVGTPARMSLTSFTTGGASDSAAEAGAGAGKEAHSTVRCYCVKCDAGVVLLVSRSAPAECGRIGSNA